MLDAYISKLGNSRPIFNLSITHNKERVVSRLVEVYSPTPDLNDPISILVCNRFIETLSGFDFITESEHMKKGVVNDIKSEMKKFIYAYGGYKNAKQSAVFRLMNIYSTPEPMINGLVYLYRHCKSLGMINGVLPSTDQKQIDNILAIIELMRSKFEPK